MKRILLLAAAVAGAVAFSSVALAGPGDRAGGKRGGRAAAFLLHRHARHHRMAALHVLRELNLTDAQKAAIKQAGFEARDEKKELRISVTGVCKFKTVDLERLPNERINKRDPYYVSIEIVMVRVYQK